MVIKCLLLILIRLFVVGCSGELSTSAAVEGSSAAKRVKKDNSNGTYNTVSFKCIPEYVLFTEPRRPASRYCGVCDENVPSVAYVGHLRSRRHTTRTGSTSLEDGVVVLQTAFACRIVSYKVTATNVHINVADFMNEIKGKITPLWERQLTKFHSMKVNLELFGIFVLETQGREDVKSFATTNEVVTFGTDLNHLYEHFTTVLAAKVAEFCEMGSGTLLIYIPT